MIEFKQNKTKQTGRILSQLLALCMCFEFVTSVFGDSDQNINLNALQQQNDFKHNALDIDANRLEYFEMENMLWSYFNWTEINVHADVSMPIKLKKVFEGHLEFMMQQLPTEYVVGRYLFSANLTLDYEWLLLEQDLWQIEKKYQFIKNYLQKSNSSERLVENVLIDFATRVLSKTSNNTLTMEQIFTNIEMLMVEKTLYYRAMSEITIDRVCKIRQSQQQFVYSLYSDIAAMELKGYIMTQFAWMILEIYGRGNFSQVSKNLHDNYQKRVQRTLNQLYEIMRHAERVVWSCDPKKFVKGESYEEVTRLLQGYIENEVDMNLDQSCRGECERYEVVQNLGCYKELYCARQPRCSGKIHNCRFIEADMNICQAASRSNRRYEYIEYESARILGEKQVCQRNTIKVESWYRFVFLHCSYCFCLCDEISLKSDRYFSLRDSLSDVTNNKVVTGLRFTKQNRVFHLQIQEGELMPRGTINATTLSWKPVSNYKIHDRSVHNGIDYHTLSFESRSIDLDDIYTDDNTFVVTGVRFRVVGAHLNLEARLSEFNFETGKIVHPEVNSFWKSNDNTVFSGGREELKIYEPDVSTRCLVESIPDSKHNQFIDFVNTNMDKDAAQTTVPFVDTQGVVSNIPMPLAGVGIYHKGRNGFGGYIAPKIITHDIAPHVHISNFMLK